MCICVRAFVYAYACLNVVSVYACMCVVYVGVPARTRSYVRLSVAVDVFPNVTSPYYKLIRAINYIVKTRHRR